MPADLRLLLHDLNQRIRQILRVGGHEADPAKTGDCCHHPQQLREADSTLCQIIAVGIHILSEQRDLLDAVLHEPLTFLQNIPGIPGFFPTAYIGYDAVGAEVVAAIADVHRSLEAELPLGRQILHNKLCVLNDLHRPLILPERLEKQLCQLVYIVCSENQLHIGILLPDGFNLLGLLHHTSRDAEDHARPILYLMLQPTDTTVQLLVGIFPDRAGGEENHIAVPVILRLGIAAGLQNTAELLAVLCRHLAADDIDHEFCRIARSLLFLHQVPYPIHKIILPLRLLCRGLPHDLQKGVLSVLCVKFHYLTCPFPYIVYLVVVSSRSPMGPLAWSFAVEMPISAPKPNSPPSVKRVDAFQ